MSEKRSLERKRRRVKIRFGVDEPRKIAFTEDISRDGIFIKTASPEKPGETMSLELTLPDESLVLCQARIYWAKRVPPNLLRQAGKGGMGLKILNYSQGEQAFKTFVASLKR